MGLYLICPHLRRRRISGHIWRQTYICSVILFSCGFGVSFFSIYYKFNLAACSGYYSRGDTREYEDFQDQFTTICNKIIRLVVTLLIEAFGLLLSLTEPIPQGGNAEHDGDDEQGIMAMIFICRSSPVILRRMILLLLAVIVALVACSYFLLY